MDYYRTYQKLMAAARRRGTDKSKLDGYYERHHILPRCLGGSKDEANLVLLTAREHFVAHRLLAKAHPGNNDLLFAVASFQMDKGGRLLTSRQVALAREANAVATSQRLAQLAAEGKHHWQTDEFREAQSQRQAQLAAEGKHHWQTAEFREASSQRLTQRNAQLAAEGKHPFQSGEFREALSRRQAQLIAEDMHHWQTAEFRKALSQHQAQLASEGRHNFQTDEFRQAQSKRMTEKATCPYCGKVGQTTVMRRWHFENCKHKEARTAS